MARALNRRPKAAERRVMIALHRVGFAALHRRHPEMLALLGKGAGTSG
jgi:hypothetical protein